MEDNLRTLLIQMEMDFIKKQLVLDSIYNNMCDCSSESERLFILSNISDECVRNFIDEKYLVKVLGLFTTPTQIELAFNILIVYIPIISMCGMKNILAQLFTNKIFDTLLKKLSVEYIDYDWSDICDIVGTFPTARENFIKLFPKVKLTTPIPQNDYFSMLRKIEHVDTFIKISSILDVYMVEYTIDFFLKGLSQIKTVDYGYLLDRNYTYLTLIIQKINIPIEFEKIVCILNDFANDNQSETELYCFKVLTTLISKWVVPDLMQLFALVERFTNYNHKISLIYDYVTKLGVDDQEYFCRALSMIVQNQNDYLRICHIRKFPDDNIVLKYLPSPKSVNI
jgi:hypothetical protein